MNLTEFRDEVIRRGEASAKQQEKGYKLVGALKGFEISKTLTTPEDFERQIVCRRTKEQAIFRSNADIDQEVYWSHRYATLQIEFVYERMKVAWGYPNLSLRAVLHFMDITGIIRRLYGN